MTTAYRLSWISLSTVIHRSWLGGWSSWHKVTDYKSCVIPLVRWKWKTTAFPRQLLCSNLEAVVVVITFSKEGNLNLEKYHYMNIFSQNLLTHLTVAAGSIFMKCERYIEKYTDTVCLLLLKWKVCLLQMFWRQYRSELYIRRLL